MQRQEVQRRIHAELDAVLGLRISRHIYELQFIILRADDVFLGKHGEVSLKTKDKLVYTNAVLYETLRLDPVAAVGLPHRTTRNTSIGAIR